MDIYCGVLLVVSFVSFTDYPAEEVAKSLDFGENDELKSSVSEKDSEFSLQLDTTDGKKCLVLKELLICVEVQAFALTYRLVN